MNAARKTLDVVAAVIEYQGKILCMQRGKAKYAYVTDKFEFPGGKIEPGESGHAALERELREEMDFPVSLSEADFFMAVEHAYPDFTIRLSSYFCHAKTDRFILKEHKSFQWLPPRDLLSLDWAAADFPIAKRLAALNLADGA